MVRVKVKNRESRILYFVCLILRLCFSLAPASLFASRFYPMKFFAFCLLVVLACSVWWLRASSSTKSSARAFASSLYARVPASWRPTSQAPATQAPPKSRFFAPHEYSRPTLAARRMAQSENERVDSPSQVPRVRSLPTENNDFETQAPATQAPATHMPITQAPATFLDDGWPSTLPLRLPGAATIGAATIGAARRLPAFSTAAAYRAWGEQAVRQDRFEEAAQAFGQEAVMYRRRGLVQAAIIQENKAARYATDVRLFLDRIPTRSEMRTLDTQARLEPPIGTYLGAFIDRDEQLRTTYFGENWQTHREPREFASLVGKAHASYFMYVAYGQKFPRRWVERLKAQNAIPHIAWEPRSMAQVKDDAYLQTFARDCASVNWPIFIRFAGEMNGFWTPYHANPALYRQKFRLMHRVLHRLAPRAATIWCVNSIPSDNIQQYYPGDDGCDWVGINLYSVPFYDNDPRRSASSDSPLALIEPIYNLYARRKPLAICEYAASHMAAVDRKRRVDFAIDKMSLLYGALPRLYPRIKMIDWFSMNNIKNARAGRQLNDYNLTSQPQLRQAYRRVISEPSFLSAPARLIDAPIAIPRPLIANQLVRGVARFSIWAKTYVSRPRVYLHIANRLVYASDSPGAHVVALDTRTIPTGRQTLTAFVFDNRDRFVRSVSVPILVAR